jgi:hypothetical protein
VALKLISYLHRMLDDAKPHPGGRVLQAVQFDGNQA